MILILRRVLFGALAAGVVATAAVAVARTATPAAPPLAAAESSSGTAAIPPGATPAGATATDDALAAELDAVLAADQASPSAGPAASERVGVRGQLRRFAAWQKLVHATVVVDLPNRGLTTVQLDHGTIGAASSTSLTIKEVDGPVTVAVGAETRVRRSGSKAAVADLRTGDEVFTMSLVESGTATASLVVVPKR